MKQEPIANDPIRSTYTFTFPLLVLVSLTLVTQIVSVASTAEKSFTAVFLPSLIALLVITVPLAALGLRLGTPIGLGAPLLTALLSRRPGAARRLGREAMLAIALGLIVGAFLWALRIITASFLPPELAELGYRGAIEGLLVSISAAVAEEVWLRLGVMTILAWIFMRTLGHSDVTQKVAWSAIVVAALAFGLIHLPQLAVAGAATPIGIVATILGNALVGVVCGWLYWQHSLTAAILAHFSVDFVLHVVTAIVG